MINFSVSGILNPVPWIDVVYSQAQYQIPVWSLVRAMEKSIYTYYSKHKTIAPDFSDYIPDILLNLDPDMTFKPLDIDYAINNILSDTDISLAYNWNTVYWILVNSLYDRISPKIQGTIWRPGIYYEREPLVISASQFNEAEALSNDPKNLIVYAIAETINNIRTTWKTEPIMPDIMENFIKILPPGVTFTDEEIEFATFYINSNPATALIYSYWMWKDAITEALTLSNRMKTEQLFYAPPGPPTDITNEQQTILEQQIPTQVEQETVSDQQIPPAPAPEEKTGWNYWLIGGAAVAALYLWKKRKG